LRCVRCLTRRRPGIMKRRANTEDPKRKPRGRISGVPRAGRRIKERGIRHIMKTRKEIIREYKERKISAGIFQIRNTLKNKVLLGSSKNLEGIWNSNRFQLSAGAHRNKKLQEDWNECGAECFIFEILEVIEEKDGPCFNMEDELTLLEQIWVEKIKPFDSNGYNDNSNIRVA